MRKSSLNSTLVLASLLLSMGAYAQTADKPEAANSQKEAPASGLSGIWLTRAPRGVGWYNYALAGPDVPMTPWAVEQFKASKPSFGPNNFEDSNDPAYACLPPGPLRVYAFGGAEMQIVQIPGRVLILFGRDVRQIYTDGREHPKNLQTTWMGHSIGHWESDTFVVDTVGIKDSNWIDRMGHTHSDQLHVVERFRRADASTLNLDMTLDDPKAFTKAWTAQRTFRLRPPSERMVERFCEEIFDHETFGVKVIPPSRE
jgi:hypothetical protein